MKSKKYFSCLVNLLNFALVVLSVTSFFTHGGEGNMEVKGAQCFCFFTIDSNILMAISSLLFCIMTLISIKKPDFKISPIFVLLKFIGTCATTLTFLTVVFFLGPIMTYSAMFAGVNLFLHLICPLLAILSILFLEEACPYKKIPCSLLGVLPTFLYGAVYLVLVVALKVWEDFYFFNAGGLWFLVYPLMLLVTFGIGMLLSFLSEKLHKNNLVS